MATRARVSKSGQVTIPAEVRERLGVKPGDTVIWGVGAHGEATVRPIEYSFEQLSGILGPLPDGVDVDEFINEAVHEGIERRHRRIMEEDEWSTSSTPTSSSDS